MIMNKMIKNQNSDLSKLSKNTSLVSRAFEIAVGCELIRLPGALYYWREKNDEVDYVYVYGRKLYAIEVKSSRKKSAKGLLKFQEHFPLAEVLLITPENFQKVLKTLP